MVWEQHPQQQECFVLAERLRALHRLEAAAEKVPLPTKSAVLALVEEQTRVCLQEVNRVVERVAAAIAGELKQRGTDALETVEAYKARVVSQDRGLDVIAGELEALGHLARDISVSVGRWTPAAATQARSEAENKREDSHPAVVADDGALSTFDEIVPLSQARERWQMAYIKRALEENEGNRSRTARVLGVDKRTIFRALEKEEGD